LLQGQALSLQGFVELSLSLEHPSDLIQPVANVGLADGHLQSGRLLAEHLQGDEILGKRLFETLVLFRLLVFVGRAPRRLVRRLELLELVLRDELLTDLGDGALRKVVFTARQEQKRQNEQAE